MQAYGRIMSERVSCEVAKPFYRALTLTVAIPITSYQAKGKIIVNFVE